MNLGLNLSIDHYNLCAHGASNNIFQLYTHKTKLSVEEGWRYCITCDKFRASSVGGQPKIRNEAFCSLACEPVEPFLDRLDSLFSPSVRVQTSARKAAEIQREFFDLEKRARARTIASHPEQLLLRHDEVLQAVFWQSRMFSKIPFCCLSRARISYLRLTMLFSAVILQQKDADFTDAFSPA